MRVGPIARALAVANVLIATSHAIIGRVADRQRVEGVALGRGESRLPYRPPVTHRRSRATQQQAIEDVPLGPDHEIGAVAGEAWVVVASIGGDAEPFVEKFMLDDQGDAQVERAAGVLVELD